MIKITFLYTDGTKLNFENLKSIQYNSSTRIVVNGDEMLKHYFPLGSDFLLQLENKSCMVSHKDLLAIEIAKVV